MTIYEKIIAEYPELTESNEFIRGSILIQNDMDDEGDFIVKWDYSKPIPDGLTIGK
jgi:hypothetical protein